MKCLSIRCGYAYLVACGYKTIEYRTWSTQHRGTMLIHSSGVGADIEVYFDFFPKLVESEKKTFKENTFYKIVDNEILCKNKQAEQDYMYYEAIMQHFENTNKKERTVETQMIIGCVDIIDCVKVGHRECEWHLKNAKLFKKPIKKVVGRLGLWEFAGIQSVESIPTVVVPA